MATGKLEPQRMSDEAVAFIQKDSTLYGKVADMIGIQPVSLPNYLNRSDLKLTYYQIVVEVAATMGLQPEDILVNESELAKTEA